jgi:hypothetical protein
MTHRHALDVIRVLGADIIPAGDTDRVPGSNPHDLLREYGPAA